MKNEKAFIGTVLALALILGLTGCAHRPTQGESWRTCMDKLHGTVQWRKETTIDHPGTYYECGHAEVCYTLTGCDTDADCARMYGGSY